MDPDRDRQRSGPSSSVCWGRGGLISAALRTGTSSLSERSARARMRLDRGSGTSTVEIFVDRIQTIGLQVDVSRSELHHDAVQGVEKDPLFHLELTAAKLPVGAEKEVVIKNSIFFRRQSTLRDQ